MARDEELRVTGDLNTAFGHRHYLYSAAKPPPSFLIPNSAFLIFPLAPLPVFLPTSCAYTRDEGNGTMKLFTRPFESYGKACGKSAGSIH